MGHFPFPFPMPPHFALLDMPVTHSVTGKKGSFSVHSSSERTGAFIRDSLFLLSLTLKGSIATGYTFQNNKKKKPSTKPDFRWWGPKAQNLHAGKPFTSWVSVCSMVHSIYSGNSEFPLGWETKTSCSPQALRSSTFTELLVNTAVRIPEENLQGIWKAFLF